MTDMENAREYVEAGIFLVKIPRGKKGPATKGWNLRENCIDTPEKADQINGGNAGITLAWARLCTIDIDNYLAAIADLEKRGIDLQALLMADDAVQISSGRENRAKLLYRLPPGVDPPQTFQFLDESKAVTFELRCASKDGTTVQDVIPPSIHPDTGKPYVWIGDWRHIPVLPQAIWDMWQERIAAERKPQRVRGNSVPGRSDAAVAAGGRNMHLASLAGAMRRKGMSPTAIDAALQAENDQACNPPLASEEVAVIARSIGRYQPERGTQSQRSEPAAAAPAQRHWRDELVMKDELKIHPGSLKNACLYIKFHPQLCGVFAKNDFSQSTDIIKKPPWDTGTRSIPRKITDEDITLAGAWLETHGIFVSSAVTASAINVAADYLVYEIGRASCRERV